MIIKKISLLSLIVIYASNAYCVKLDMADIYDASDYEDASKVESNIGLFLYLAILVIVAIKMSENKK